MTLQLVLQTLYAGRIGHVPLDLLAAILRHKPAATCCIRCTNREVPRWTGTPCLWLEGGLGPCLGLIHRRVDRVDAFYSHDHVGKMLSLDTFGQYPFDDDIRVKML